MRPGEYAPVSGSELRKLRKQHNLTQAQLAVLARSRVHIGNHGQFIARRIQEWEAGRNRIPLASCELLQLKLKLMEHGATFEELAESPAADVANNIMSRYRNMLRELRVHR